MTILNNNYREFKLDNGLVVALQETPTSTVSGRLRVWNGALNEEQGEEGLAHFLEHTLMTGGSQKYTPEQADDIRGIFGAFNALTHLDKTVFPIDMLSEDTPLFLEYISDIVFNPRFDETRIEEERQRILRETADKKSGPSFESNKKYLEAFFGKDSPHIYFGLGDENVVKSASREDLRKIHSRGYHPNNMDLVLVGNLPENIEEIIKQTFGEFSSKGGNRIELPRNPKLKGNRLIHFEAPELLNHENLEQSTAYLNMGFVGPTETDEDSYGVRMLVHILGGDSNSRLFKNVSQRKGLVYGIGAQYNGMNNQGMIAIEGNIPSLRIKESIDSIFEEMGILQTELVSEEVLTRLKKILKYGFANTFDSNIGHVGAIELRMDIGINPEDYFERMEAITPKDIKNSALKYFPTKNGNYVMLLRDPLKE